MSNNSEKVKRWRKRTKERIVESMGGKCVCCGYQKCADAMDVHHLDPSKKEMGFGAVRANIVSWARIVDELKKCVLVCSNCHREIHNGITVVPVVVLGFDCKYEDYKTLEATWVRDECPICGSLKSAHLITCSRECAAKKARKVNWDNIDISKMLKEGISISSIADQAGVSWTAVKKRMKKLNIVQ
jgi:hypothetical protein